MKESARPLPPARARFKRYPAYKDSGVEWLGEIPAHWEAKRLKYVAPVTDERSNVVTPDFPFIGLEHIESGPGRLVRTSEDATTDSAETEGAASLFRPGDVLFGKLRPYLAKVLRPEFNGCCSTELLVLRSTGEIAPCILAYQLLSRDFIGWVNAMTYGTKMPRANPDQVMGIPVAVASNQEQLVIAAFLDRETARIDALVAKKGRVLELLHEKRTALIRQAVTKGTDPNVPMKVSGVEWLGEIPAHWEAKRLKHLLRPQKGAIKTGPFGSQLQSADMQAGEIKVYNQRSVLDRDFATGENYVSLEKFQELHAFETFPGDLLITTRGSIGRCAILPEDAERGILHPCLMRIQVDQRKVSARFLEILIQDGDFILEQLRLLSNATTIDVIYSDTLKEVSIVVPPLKDQDLIVRFTERETARIDELMAKVRDAIDSLKEFRTALISAAVTGKIDVRGEVA